MRGHWQRINRKSKSGCGDDWWSSIKETKIPKTMRGKLKRVETDAECHGADKVYKKVAGKINACFYSSTDEKKIRQVYDRKGRDSNMGGLYNTLRDDFCSRRDNVFKNPGGGLCQEYDTGKRLAKQYCAVGDRMATDSSCTPKNLGNAYASLAAAFCKTAAGKKHAWCSCYNVTNGVCKKDASAAGCAKKKETFDELVAATPKKFRNSWNGMESCFGGVCAGDKYLPEGYNANCSRPVQVCCTRIQHQRDAVRRSTRRVIKKLKREVVVPRPTKVHHPPAAVAAVRVVEAVEARWSDAGVGARAEIIYWSMAAASPG